MDVLFFDEERKSYQYHLPKAFDEGSNGTIHRISSDICLKWFTDDNYYDIDTIKTIKALELANFYKIYKLLYDKLNNFSGYTMKYYEPEEFDILSMPVDYTLANLTTIAKSLTHLSAKKIYAIDLFEANTVRNKNRITIIDADGYKHRSKDKIKDVYRYNLRALYRLMSEIYFNDLVAYHHPFYIDKEIIDSLFDYSLTPNEVCKKLTRYKYPIEYIEDVRRRT